jgi:serine protease Do
MEVLRMNTRTAVASLTTASVIAIAAGLHGFPGASFAQSAPQTPAAAAASATPTVARQGTPDFAALVEKEGPAVVNISTTARRTAATSGGDEDADNPGVPGDPLFEFFRRFQPRIPGQPGMPGNPRGGNGEEVRRGVGSGFIVSKDGFILTNAHVVEGASEVNVRLTDKREFKAKVVGVDKRTDIALIKIDANNLPIVNIGDPQKVRVGEWVAAIGSPFGFDNSVTAGIVSAKSRNLPTDSYVPFLQTDVAVNPGNSGGPLFNLAGEVIGINSQIYSRSGGYMGVSFAIPIDVAMKVKDDLQKYGKVSRGRLGVTIQSVTKELADSFGLAKAEGALVNTVEKDSPAAQGGIKAGDIVLAVNGKPVESSADLPRMIGEARPGDSVNLRVQREGKPRDISVRLGEAPQERVASAPTQKPEAARPTGKLGLAVRPAGDAEKERLPNGGVIVEQVTGPAEKAGLQRGDAILAINSQPVTTPEQLRDLAQKAGDRMALLIDRQGTRLFVPLRIAG